MKEHHPPTRKKENERIPIQLSITRINSQSKFHTGQQQQQQTLGIAGIIDLTKNPK